MKKSFFEEDFNSLKKKTFKIIVHTTRVFGRDIGGHPKLPQVICGIGITPKK